MNPMSLLHLKPMLEKFRNNHPKVPMFFNAISGEVGLDSIIEVRLTTAAGKTMVTNFRVNQDDMDLFSELRSQIKK